MSSPDAPPPAAGASTREESWLASGLWCSASVGWSLPTAAERWPDRVALILGEQPLTFAGLLARVEAVAAEFAARGAGPGDRVVVQLPNCVELVVVIMAAWHIGAVAVPVVPLYRRREMAHILRVTAPAVVVAAARRGDRSPAAELEDMLPGRPARYAVGEVDGWSSLPVVRQPAPHRPAAPDECCLLLFTSGTTADPKGVRHNSRSLLCEARSYRDEALLGAGTPVLVPAPIAHIGAAVAATLLPCLTGAPTVVLASWDADLAVAVCDRERVALAIGAPVFLSEMLDRYEAPGACGHRIAMFHTGAAPTGSTVIRRAQHAGITAWRAWGMTEAPTMTSGRPDDPLTLRESTDGRIDTGCEVWAVDEHGGPQPPGVAGELQIRGPKLMMGYLGAPARSMDDWFTTGDIGTVDAGGRVTIRGRIKDIINRGGEKFSAAEIETAIGTHPAIAAVAVVGVPHERLGEEVAAFVTVRPGTQWPGDAVLTAHLEAQHLARQNLPVVWEVLADLPRTPTGKIQKRELLAWWTHQAADSGVITSEP